MATPAEKAGPGRPKNNIVSVTLPSGEEKTKAYVREDIETKEDVLQMLQDDARFETLVADFNYGHDLKIRAGIRSSILDEYAGPEKALNKMAEQIIKLRASAGKPPITMEEALIRAKRQMEED